MCHWMISLFQPDFFILGKVHVHLELAPSQSLFPVKLNFYRTEHPRPEVIRMEASPLGIGTKMVSSWFLRQSRTCQPVCPRLVPGVTFLPAGQRLGLSHSTPMIFLYVLLCEEGWVSSSQGQYQFAPS